MPTMREHYMAEGYSPDELTNPKDVDPEDITEGTTIVVDTVVRNPDLDGPATTRDIVEWEIGPEDVHRARDIEEVTDGAVSYPESTPVTHAVIWGHKGHAPAVQSVGYHDKMYDEDSQFEDPHRWERTRENVWGLSDDFVRFKLP